MPLFCCLFFCICFKCQQAAIRDPDPVCFLENELMYGTAFEMSGEALSKDHVGEIGKAKIQKAGKDITIVAHSIGVHFAMQAAEELAKTGISAEVVNLRSIRPLDMDTVNESVMKTNHLITVEGTYYLEKNQTRPNLGESIVWI